MARSWTDAQRVAFELKDRNILVAAAAGSGKTAVLVERIINKITDSDNPIDVDELVVVTFTKAAAAEMKQRIRDAIDDLVEQDPDNMHLIKQLTLINNAQISTIDSFCLGIIRNHFTEVDLDPCFRTADEGEIKLLENDIMEEMLEEYYSSANEEFLEFVDAYGTGRDDSDIEDMILKVYRFARSNPWPEQWYKQCLMPYVNSDLENSMAFTFLNNNIRNILTDYSKMYERMVEICNEPQGPLMYADAVQADLAGIKHMLLADSYAELGRRCRLISFDALGRKKVADVSEDKKEYVKNMRDSYKKYVNGTLLSKIFISDAEDMAEALKENFKAVNMLITIAKDFGDRIDKEKRARNIIDFNDMEHLALNVLVHMEDGVKTYTDAASSLTKKYNEIMIDEYQDSNLLQEEILTAVSKSHLQNEINNVYMVGDVKQSIYKFRLACPQLFIDKYNSYSTHDASSQKIQLQTNFRSRKNVLECTNDVFRRAMNKEFCGIEYDIDARLNSGLEYPKEDGDFGGKELADTEVVLINAPEIAGADARDVEGAKIAEIIKDIHKTCKVYDAKTHIYRKIKYSDIVILTRSVAGWAVNFVNALMNEGIPAYCESNSGYYETFEIKAVVNFLSVIDNPTKDIDMSAAMLSYFGGFSADELAHIRMLSKNDSLYNQLKLAAGQAAKHKTMESESEAAVSVIGNSEILKSVRFLELLNLYRGKSEYMSIQELTWELAFDTGYYDYVGTMPAGKQRQANVDILLQRAGSFETTSYSGLFNFLRYIERMKKYEVDYGEASVLGENEDLVRVMSIHKSKGLEFPVVIVAGMHKQMNFKDSSGNIVIDQDLGVGMDIVRLDKRTRNRTAVKAAVSQKLNLDTIAEEQRVLYVAMTRAREKLIMTGISKDAYKSLEKWNKKALELAIADTFSYLDNENFKSYFDMVMPVALLDESQNLGKFQVKIVESESEKDEDVSEGESLDIDAESSYQKDETLDNSVSDISNSTSESQDTVNELYPAYKYGTETNKKMKITVSELKKMQHDTDIEEKAQQEESLIKAKIEIDAEEISDNKGLLDENDSCNGVIPEFIAGRKTKLAGNERGTAYHRVMECLDYEMTESDEKIKECIEDMAADGRMTRIQADCIDVSDIKRFCDSKVGKRIAKAIKAGKVRREQPFVFRPQGVEQLVQGVIDLYFEEDDELVIVDYKTDRVKKGETGENELKERYTIQLDYYAQALEQITGKKVKDKVIYSFWLGQEILL